MSHYSDIAWLFAMYFLGVRHRAGYEGVRNLLVAIASGWLWPLMIAYGIYLAHFAKAGTDG